MKIQFPAPEGRDRGRKRLIAIAVAALLAGGVFVLVFFAWWSMNPGYFKCGHAHCG